MKTWQDIEKQFDEKLNPRLNDIFNAVGCTMVQFIQGKLTESDRDEIISALDYKGQLEFKSFLHSTLDEYVKDLIPMENKRKPTHGTCCTCQECGYGYDDCVCQKNTWSRELLKQHEENMK